MALKDEEVAAARAAAVGTRVAVVVVLFPDVPLLYCS